MFCRWILLCFKREFHQSDAMSIWESCWTNLQTEFFHLFVATAIIEIYAEEVISQAMSSDDILLYFSNLSGKMDATLVLFKVIFHCFDTPSLHKLTSLSIQLAAG